MDNPPNEVSDGMSLEEYLNFIEVQPSAYNLMLLREKMAEKKAGYPHEIIYHDLPNNEDGPFAEYRAGKVKITVERLYTDYEPSEEGKDSEMTAFYDVYLYYGDIISLRLDFCYDSNDMNPYMLTKDGIYLEGGDVDLKLTEEERKLVEQMEKDIGEKRYV